MDAVIPKLVPEDFEKDEKQRTVSFTEAGQEHIEELLRDAGMLQEGGLYDINNISLVHHANQALRAYHLFARDTDYIVKDDKVIIIDEFTGRAMEGRRYSEGLHQSLEAKEGVTHQNENHTRATITYQNSFPLYPKHGGMTGTAMTEAAEFAEIYSLEVVEIPTNVPVTRKDFDDEVYRTAEEKWDAIIDTIAECREKGQPVLVGTVSIEKSELLSGLMNKRRIDHKILNARFHKQEATIIAQAGQPGAVTIATNMAGRGTDIQLGGNADMRIALELGDDADPAKVEAFRAEVEGRRKRFWRLAGFMSSVPSVTKAGIDNQLRGRSGRQGDPGASVNFPVARRRSDADFRLGTHGRYAEASRPRKG